MMFNTVIELNKLFGVAEIPVIADRIEALGPDVLLVPSNKRRCSVSWRDAPFLTAFPKNREKVYTE
jgi:hypothetical protein